MIGRIFFFLLTGGLGLAIIVYTLQFVNIVGKNAWAESKLGSGGTYIMWKVIGVVIILFGFLVLIGQVKLNPEPQTCPPCPKVGVCAPCPNGDL